MRFEKVKFCARYNLGKNGNIVLEDGEGIINLDSIILIEPVQEIANYDERELDKTIMPKFNIYYYTIWFSDKLHCHITIEEYKRILNLLIKKEEVINEKYND